MTTPRIASLQLSRLRGAFVDRILPTECGLWGIDAVPLASRLSRSGNAAKSFQVVGLPMPTTTISGRAGLTR